MRLGEQPLVTEKPSYEELEKKLSELRALSQRLIQAQEEEKRFIGRELHDQTGQFLTYVGLLLDKAMRTPPEKVGPILSEAKDIVGQVINQVRDLSLSLCPPTLEELGLVAALEGHIDRYTQKTQIRIDFQPVGVPEDLPQDINLVAYRIVQEALTNVARHAKVSEVRVSLWVENDMLNLSIEDKGAGFAPGHAEAGAGVTGMRERARLLGGSFSIDSAPGAGTRVGVRLPLQESGQGHDHHSTR